MSEHAASGGDSGGGGGGNMKLIIVFAVVGLVLIVASIGGTLFFTGFFSGTHNSAPAAPVEIDYTNMPRIYYEIKPAFIANAIEEDRLHFVLAEISIMSKNQAVIDGVTANLIGIRNQIREALSGHAYIEVLGSSALESLRAQALVAINSYLEHRHIPTIDALYFISFVVQ